MALLNWLIISLIFVFNLLYLPNTSFPAMEPRWSLLNLAALALPAIFLLNFSIRSNEEKLPVRLHPFQVFSLLLIIWLSFSTIWAVDRIAVLNNFFNYGSFVVLVIFFSYYLEEIDKDRLALSLCLSATIVSLIGMMQYFGLVDNLFVQEAKPAATFVNKNLATPVVALALPLMYLKTVFNNSRNNVVFYCCFVISSNYLLVAMTKSSLLACAGVFIITLVIIFSNKSLRSRLRESLNKKLLVFVGIWLAVLSLTVNIHGQGTYPEMSRPISSSLEVSDIGNSFSTRTPKWTNSLAIIKDFPLRGVGVGNFSAIYPYYHKSIVEDKTYSTRFWLGGLHNDPLQYLVELGLVGFFLLAAMFLTVCRGILVLIRDANRQFSVVSLGCFLGVTGLLIDSFFNYPLHEPTSLFFCAVLSGAVIAEYHANNDLQSLVGSGLKLDKRLFMAVGGMAAAALFFLAVPYTVAKLQSFKAHHYAMQLYKHKQLERSYRELKKSVSLWPNSSIIMAETSTMSYDLLKRSYSPESYTETLYFNQEALKGHPFRYILNYIRISLLKDSENQTILAKAEEYTPLLLRVAPDNNIVEAYSLIFNKNRAEAGKLRN